MSVSSAIAGDYLLIDGLQTVTISPRTGADIEDVKAHQPESTNTLGSNPSGGLEPEAETTTFIVWSATLDGNSLYAGYKLTQADSTVWVIGSVSEKRHGTVSINWSCVCRKEVS